VEFPLAQAYRDVGILKEVGDTGKAMFEAVYIRNQKYPPTQEQVEMAQTYLERGEDLGLERSLRYYSGVPVSLKRTADGSVVFRFLCQQRDGALRAFNPEKGQLLYIGKLGNRSNQ